jgi:succinate dehydrogenase hydrophobic anchor subunit
MRNFEDYQKRSQESQQRLFEAFAQLGRLMITAFYHACNAVSACVVDHKANRRMRKAFRKGNLAQCRWYVQNRAQRIVSKL